jgi:transcription-repair coupling factor (superfamily II helicase)
VSVDGAALLPDEYVADEAQKLHLYRRISRVERLEEVDSIRRELRDRYGPLPPEVEILLDTTALRLLGTEMGIERILVRAWEARVNFRAGVVPRMALLQQVFTDRQFEVELRRPSPLSLTLHPRGPEPIAATLVRALTSLRLDRSKAA